MRPFVLRHWMHVVDLGFRTVSALRVMLHRDLGASLGSDLLILGSSTWYFIVIDHDRRTMDMSAEKRINDCMYRPDLQVTDRSTDGFNYACLPVMEGCSPRRSFSLADDIALQHGRDRSACQTHPER